MENSLTKHDKLKFPVALIIALAVLITFKPDLAFAETKYKADTLPKGSTVRVLVVGNSFSVDTTEHLYTVLKAAGYKPIVGNLERGSCTLEFHSMYFQSDGEYYVYRKNATGSWKKTSDSAKASSALSDEPWDFIFFQQQSACAGYIDENQWYTFRDNYNNGEIYYLDTLKQIAKDKCENSNIVFGYEMTWAVPEIDKNLDDTSEYSRYYADETNHYSRSLMYRGICETTVSEVLNPGSVDLIDVVGTAIENAYFGYLGNALYHDDRHLSKLTGRAFAAMSLASCIGADISSIDSISIPSVNIHIDTFKKAIADSEKNPYSITAQTTTAPKLCDYKITLSNSKYTYNGNAKKPTVNVKGLKKNQDYKLTYSSNKKVGFAKVQITGTDSYSGSVTKRFEIIPKKTSISNLKSGQGNFTVKWIKKAPQVTGYQVRYSTSKAFKTYKTKTIKSYKTTSKTIKKLKRHKRYYVKVRTYKEVNNRRHYGKWSKVKRVKTN